MQKIKIFVSDDEVLFSSGVRRLLEAEQDFEVVGEANDGQEAVRCALELVPDVVIMNVNMPKLNGIEAARQIKESIPSCNILMLSPYKNGSYILPAMQARVAGFLHKGITFNELVSAIRNIIAGKHVIDETAAFNILSGLVSSDGDDSSIYLEHLHDREIEILRHAATGLTNKEIAEKLELSERTIQSHFANIFRKLNVSSRTEAIFHALKEGWLSLEDIK